MINSLFKFDRMHRVICYIKREVIYDENQIMLSSGVMIALLWVNLCIIIIIIIIIIIVDNPATDCSNLSS